MPHPSEPQFPGDPHWDRLRARTAAAADPVAVIREDQADRWAGADRLAVEEYRDHLPGLTDEDLLVLVVGEVALRREAGEGPTPGEYQARFPHLADDIAVQFQLLDLSADPTAPGADRTGRPGEDTVPRRTLGRYRLLSEIGRGGMGTVYLAYDTQLDRRVALKVPRFGGGHDPRAVERFHREARAAAGLHHPNLCPVFDTGRADGVEFFTMPYLEGGSLAAMLTRVTPLSVEEAVRLTRQIAVGLEAAHRVGIVHRDLKPSNILLGAAGDPVVTDFGLARRVGPNEPSLTDAGAVIGTAAYLPPEQIGCDPDAMGPRCDVYSLGVILYELLTGRVPFTGTPSEVLQKVLVEEPQSPAALRPGLDPRLAAVALTAMAKDPRRRFASMGELVAALDETMSPAPEPGRPRFPNRRAALAAAVVGVIAVGVGTRELTWRHTNTPDTNRLPAAGTPLHPLTPGTEWLGTFAFRGTPIRGDVSLKVTEQDGASFKGVYATEGGRFMWEAVGTAADGTVRWEITRALTDAARGTGAAGVAKVEGTYTARTLTVVYRDHDSQADMTLALNP